MSDFLIKGETLTNIADAIRGVSGKQITIKVEDMPSEISNLGGELTQLSIIENTGTRMVANCDKKPKMILLIFWFKANFYSTTNVIDYMAIENNGEYERIRELHWNNDGYPTGTTKVVTPTYENNQLILTASSSTKGFMLPSRETVNGVYRGTYRLYVL